jgi:hypothetical protein
MEMPGLYGPYVCHERVLQRIWLQGDFDRTRAVTTDGERVEVLSVGKWNLLGGPDFLGARLRIGGRVVFGDVEVHFRQGDWNAHAHEEDPAYAAVVLHVVLFPLAPDTSPTRTQSGASVPSLVLMPLLLRDLEEYASDDALERITSQHDWQRVEELAMLPVGAARTLLVQAAERRWRQKVGFARVRIGRLGWEEAAHHTVLEILGYRFNRSPMLLLASRHPLSDWVRGKIDSERALTAAGFNWQWQGVRPANHPRTRLEQYRAWVLARSDWPARLAEMASVIPPLTITDIDTPTRRVRASVRLTDLRDRIGDRVLAAAVGGTRLDNLVCDGFLPLLAVRMDRNLFAVWFHWFAGDLPVQIAVALRTLGQTGPAQPFCQGLGQGLLGWRLDREIRASS